MFCSLKRGLGLHFFYVVADWMKTLLYSSKLTGFNHKNITAINTKPIYLKL